MDLETLQYISVFVGGVAFGVNLILLIFVLTQKGGKK